MIDIIELKKNIFEIVNGKTIPNQIKKHIEEIYKEYENAYREYLKSLKQLCDKDVKNMDTLEGVLEYANNDMIDDIHISKSIIFTEYGIKQDEMINRLYMIIDIYLKDNKLDIEDTIEMQVYSFEKNRKIAEQIRSYIVYEIESSKKNILNRTKTIYTDNKQSFEEIIKEFGTKIDLIIEKVILKSMEIKDMFDEQDRQIGKEIKKSINKDNNCNEYKKIREDFIKQLKMKEEIQKEEKTEKQPEQKNNFNKVGNKEKQEDDIIK